METSLETVALFSLKLAYEEEGLSPILRDDMVMGDYQKDVFELLVRRGDVETIQFKMNECLGLAMDAFGGDEKPLGVSCESFPPSSARRVRRSSWISRPSRSRVI